MRISTYLALVFVCPALSSCTAYYSSAEDRGVDVEPEALPDEGGDTVRDVEGEENPFSNVDPVWEWTPYEEQLEGYAPIPAGRFTMGCSPGDTMCCLTDCWWPFSIEKPHEVIITRDFWMKETEVTQGEWEALTGYNNTIYTGCGPDCPQDNISWWEMAAFCNLLSQEEDLEPCYTTDEAGTAPYDLAAANVRAHPHWVRGLECEGYRLPTEAEWEYAARAGATTPYFNGTATDENLDRIGWYGRNSACGYAGCELENCRSGVPGGLPPSGIHPVAQKAANDYGLYDMSGNLWEFVWDVFGEYHDGPVEDPTGPVAHGTNWHVARGGSWLNLLGEARVSARDGDDCTCDIENGPGIHIGFRTARTKK